MAHSSVHRNERRLVCERAAAGDGPAGDSAAGGEVSEVPLRGVAETGAAGSAVAGRQGTPEVFDEGASAVGDRDKWTHRFRASQSGCSRSAIERAYHYAWPGGTSKKALRTPSLSATALGICLPHGGRGLWEWEFYPAGVGRMNLSAPEPIAFTRIRTIC